MLNQPAKYFPLEKGVYEVLPGLRPLGWNFGNGSTDSQVFQLDNKFDHYLANKVNCRVENISKYYRTSEFDDATVKQVCRFLIHQLTKEYPHFFSWDSESGFLQCRLTGEELKFSSDYGFVGPASYLSGFDALSSQIQEDVAVFKTEGDRNWLSAIHLCSPNHWSPEEKVGKNFVAIHEPIPGIEKVNRASKVLLDAVIKKGPSVRFAWGCASDERLNHHPQPPPTISAEEWRGRDFSFQSFYLRIERQVLWGLPQVNSCLFFIRTYFLDSREMTKSQLQLVSSALTSMTPESRKYKGVPDSFTGVKMEISASP